MDHGVPAGAFADVAMFSFAPFKPLGSAGNGAMLVTNDEAIHNRLRLLVGYGYSPEPVTPSAYQNYVAEGFKRPA